MTNELLRSARKSKGYTQAQVANEAKISVGGYTNIENGKRMPSVSVAKSIAKILDIEWSKIFENSNRASHA